MLSFSIFIKRFLHDFSATLPGITSNEKAQTFKVMLYILVGETHSILLRRARECCPSVRSRVVGFELSAQKSREAFSLRFIRALLSLSRYVCTGQYHRLSWSLYTLFSGTGSSEKDKLSTLFAGGGRLEQRFFRLRRAPAKEMAKPGIKFGACLQPQPRLFSVGRVLIAALGRRIQAIIFKS